VTMAGRASRLKGPKARSRREAAARMYRRQRTHLARRITGGGGAPTDERSHRALPRLNRSLVKQHGGRREPRGSARSSKSSESATGARPRPPTASSWPWVSAAVAGPGADGITLMVTDPRLVSSYRENDKQAVGQSRPTFRAIRKTEPYRAREFRYAGEVMRRKAGRPAN